MDIFLARCVLSVHILYKIYSKQPKSKLIITKTKLKSKKTILNENTLFVQNDIERKYETQGRI